MASLKARFSVPWYGEEKLGEDHHTSLLVNNIFMPENYFALSAYL